VYLLIPGKETAMKYTIKLFALSFVLSLGYIVPSPSAQTPNNISQLPTGKWVLAHHPYSRPGYEKMPMVITSVKGDATKGLEISVTELRNQTSKSVKTYKLSWYLYRTDDPNLILLKGDTPFVYPGKLAANERRQVDIPVVAFIDIYKPLMKNGSLTGNFVIDVAVTEVQFNDGTTWKGEGIPAELKK
jgi:hypothetical protein